MNNTTSTSTRSINAGLYGEFYIVTTDTNGAATVSQAYNTFTAACEAI